MKFIITESKLQKAALLWMNKNFSPDQLEVVEHPDYPDSIFYKKNGIVVMEQDKKNKEFWFSYNQIWSFFESFFTMEYEEIQGLLDIWLDEAFKLKGYTPIKRDNNKKIKLEEAFKLKGYTPITPWLEAFNTWKRLSN